MAKKVLMNYYDDVERLARDKKRNEELTEVEYTVTYDHRIGMYGLWKMDSWNEIKMMIADREIEPCPRMNTESCLYGAYNFPDPDKLPIGFDVHVLMNCDRCIFRVLRARKHIPGLSEV